MASPPTRGPKKLAKQLLLSTLRAGGAFRLVRDSRWRRERLLILCYHSISLADEHEWRRSLFMTADELEARFRLLRDGGYNVLPLGEAVRRLYAGDLPERSVALTFDDGTYDFYALAHPLLRAYGFPATVYLTTHYCVHRFPVFHLICSYMLWKRRGDVVRTRAVLGREWTLDLRSPAGQEAALQALIDFTNAERLRSPEKDRVAAELAGALGIDYEELRESRILQIMSPAEAAELAAAGVDIQLHTHRHRSPEDEALYRAELRDNREVIESITSTTPAHFCYPSGVHKPAFLPWLAAEGVVSATTTDPDLAERTSEPLLLPRLVDHAELTEIEFRAWLTGLGGLLPHRRAEAFRPTGDRALEARIANY